jgi:hypothetical protein
MSQFNQLASFSSNLLSEDEQYKQIVLASPLSTTVKDFLIRNAVNNWKEIHEIINLLMSSPSRATLLSLTKYAIAQDNYFPLAIAQLLNIKLPYDHYEVKKGLAEMSKNSTFDVIKYLYDARILEFTPILAKYAAKSNNLEYFKYVVNRITTPLDYYELRDIAEEHNAYEIVAYLNNILMTPILDI